jgi:spermidine/putrescine transport system permease protein
VTGNVRISWLGVYAVLFIVLLYGPVLMLPMFSFNDSIYIAFPLKSFTTKWYVEMVNNPSLMAALKNSLKVGIAVAIISTALGLLAAKAVTRYRLPGKGPVVGMVMVPLVVPSIILGIALLVVLRRVFSVDLSLWTIGAGHVMICTPFAMLVLMSRLEGFDKSLEEASLDLGESAWSTFWRVTFPLALPGIVSSLLLTFTESLDEFVIAFFLAGNESTLPLFIWSQLRFPNTLPGVLALGSCILVLSFVIVVLAEMVRRRGVQSSKPTAF